ncbi:hypothetical protein BB559_004425 [Furculomyces boomerangus]|uniref:Uncharacterized protein n=1 Tax=Furculomyces boomerangus TaxID=61424 RepID=A0A2T9YET5_9FUNG|nr:hypothetical protein BB559_004425 [Furculomyces boomerangus]
MEKALQNEQEICLPFTKDEVEIMRAMWIRETKKKYGIAIGIISVVCAIIIGTGIYIFGFGVFNNLNKLTGTQKALFVLYFAFLFTTLGLIYFVNKRYKKITKILENPQTHPGVILSGKIHDIKMDNEDDEISFYSKRSTNSLTIPNCVLNTSGKSIDFLDGCLDEKVFNKFEIDFVGISAFDIPKASIPPKAFNKSFVTK